MPSTMAGKQFWKLEAFKLPEMVMVTKEIKTC